MGRNGIGYHDVANTASELQSKGINPTVDNIREHLKTGSRSTIGPYLKQWRSRQEEQGTINGLPPELATVVTGLYQNLQLDAERKIISAEEAAKSEIETIQSKLDEKSHHNATLEKELQTLNIKLHDIETQNSNLSSDLEKEHKHNLVLSTKIETYEQLLHDKTQQIHLLEKQFNNLQTNLEHYRESTNAQREKDKRAFERESDLLNREINEQKQRIQQIQTINHDLTNKLEASLLEKEQLQTEWHENKGKIMSLQEQLKTNEIMIKNLNSKNLILSEKITKLKNKLDIKINIINQANMEIVILEEKIKASYDLLKRSEDFVATLQNERLFLTQENTEFKMRIQNLEKV